MSSERGDEPIAIVGSGRVGQALGRALVSKGALVVAVASRSAAHADSAAAFIGGGVRAVGVAEVAGLASRVIIAVTDRYIVDVAEMLAADDLRDAIVVHTSGAMGTASLQPLRDRGAACGVMHPLQTIGDAALAPAIFANVPFAVLGDARAVEWATSLAALLGAWVLHPREQHLASYHAAAVIAGNSMFAIVDAAARLMVDAGVPDDLAGAALGPLARTSLEHALAGGAEMLTGPVARADLGTLRRHLEATRHTPPHLRALYTATSLYLAEMARGESLSDDDVAALNALFATSK